jgi:putative flavoprotein involved in K+ transport
MPRLRLPETRKDIDMTIIDTLIIGAGQAGLATAHAVRAAGDSFVLLEAGEEAVGSWPRYYDSLTLFSPARYSSLPGLSLDGDPDRYPHRDEVVAYLRRYAAWLDADIRFGQRVTEVGADGPVFTVRTAAGLELTARRIISATGGFGSPYRPRIPALDGYTGRVLHSADYRNPDAFAGQRVVVIGAGNSAVQIAVELAERATVTLATRAPVRFMPQRVAGRDMHFWLAVTRLDTAGWAKPLLTSGTSTPAFDLGDYAAAIARGAPERRSMFTAATGTILSWPDGTSGHADTVLLATGYRPAVQYLAGLDALEPTGLPCHRGGLSTTHPNLGYVGLEWQRSFSSATLRGVARDARHVISRLGRTERRGETLPVGGQTRAGRSAGS